MAWNRTTRETYSRSCRRHEADLTDEEREIVERPLEISLREVFNAKTCMLATGCQWRALPRCFGSHSTIRGHFHKWLRLGAWGCMLEALGKLDRELVGRKAC